MVTHIAPISSYYDIPQVTLHAALGRTGPYMEHGRNVFVKAKIKQFGDMVHTQPLAHAMVAQ